MASAIALLGSSRRHGNTGRLMDQIAAALSIEVVDLGELDISPYDYLFTYLGMKVGGTVHANCRDGFTWSIHEAEVAAFAHFIRAPRHPQLSA